MGTRSTLARLFIGLGLAATSLVPVIGSPVHKAAAAGCAPKAMTGGAWDTVVVRCDGTAWAWGYNGSGELGTGDTTGWLTRRRVILPPGASAAAAGAEHGLALASGVVWAWGDNLHGELGNGSTTNNATPSQVARLSKVSTIAAGLLGAHSLAVKTDGTAWSWGNNSDGELGDGTTIDRTSPVQVLTNVKAIAGGSQHSVSAKNDGTVWAWGYNYYGQVGQPVLVCQNGTCSTPLRPSPLQVPGLTGVTAVAAGAEHSLALKTDGTVWAWGDNENSQLGNGTTTSTATPQQVAGLSGVTAIAAGGYHSLALKSDGTVWAWGYNAHGELGDGTATQRSTPVRVSGLTGISTIGAGANHSLAGRNDGSEWAWGSNSYGQVGDGSASNRYAPAQAVNSTPFGARFLSAWGQASAAEVDWDPPFDDGGSAIMSYTVQTFTSLGNVQVSSVSVTAPRTSYVVTNLVPGVAYYFKVTALNAVGASSVVTSNAATAATSAVQPCAPVVPSSAARYGPSTVDDGARYTGQSALDARLKSASLLPAVQSQFGTRYAGAWIDHSSSPARQCFAIVSGTSADLNVIRSLATGPVDLVALGSATAKYSSDQLKSYKSTISSIVFGYPGAARVARRDDSNLIEVTTTASNSARNAAVLAQVPADAVRFVVDPTLVIKTMSDPPRYTYPPYQGNFNLINSDNSGCTSGFTFVDAAGNLLGSAAGHCSPAIHAAVNTYPSGSSTLYQIGATAQDPYDQSTNGTDYEIFSLFDQNASPQILVNTHDPNNPISRTVVTRWTGDEAGAENVCVNTFQSRSCGDIDQDDVDLGQDDNGHYHHQMSCVNTPIFPGDSGSAVYHIRYEDQPALTADAVGLTSLQVGNDDCFVRVDHIESEGAVQVYKTGG